MTPDRYNQRILDDEVIARYVERTRTAADIHGPASIRSHRVIRLGAPTWEAKTMNDDTIPPSVYRMTDDELLEEYHALDSQAEPLTSNRKARFHFVIEELKARNLARGAPIPTTNAHDEHRRIERERTQHGH
ncbi:hypothetical protein AN948_03340 [Rhodococcus sp. ADH]|nr:hypothetical protein AN948_03340 [Rhodococcus sp. ADH]RGP46766.1 hypothetical protein AWH04_07920 [Rhodococcus erythropolis]